MMWTKTYHYIDQYEYVSSNQHGSRYRIKRGPKKVSVAKISSECDDAKEMRTLILLSHTLDLPVRYDYGADPQVAYIEVIGKEAL